MCFKESANKLVSQTAFDSPIKVLKNVGNVDLPEEYTKMNDILTISTHLTEKVFGYINRQITDSNLYKIIFCTTQPIHIVVALLTASIAYSLYAPTAFQASLQFVNFLYLCAVSLHTGAQFWMTFVSGLSLYFALPRHHFGEVQRILFPRYFLFNAATSFITLTIYLRVKRHAVSWNMDTALQVYVLTSCFLVESLIRIYLTPPLIILMQQKNDLEVKAGSGGEIAKYNLGTLATCPIYKTIYKQFRKVHMKVAVGNMYTLACSIFHLYYLSTKIIN